MLIAGAEDTIVGFDRGIQRRSAYIGALVGYNSGTVRGCAAAGYRAKALANSGSAVYVGGFIGYNEGYVEQCSVSSPSVYAENVFAQLSAGGFAGRNDGRIEGCYGIAAINVPTVRGGEVELGGFAAHNGGIIRRRLLRDGYVLGGRRGGRLYRLRQRAGAATISTAAPTASGRRTGCTARRPRAARSP